MENLVKCIACGKEIARGVSKCPSCGKDQRNFPMRHKILTAIGVLFTISVVSRLGNMGNVETKKEVPKATVKETEKPKPIAVTTDKLFKELDTNALKASKTYKGKVVEVTGKLSNIDSSGKYFSLGSMKEEFSFESLACDIEDEHLDTVMEFKNDQEVTVTGTISDVGEVLGYRLDVETIK